MRSGSLREHLPSADHPWVTVTAVRDPIRRTVATFFESAIRMGHLTTESTVSSIEEHMRPRWEQMPLNWFNVQFKATLDVDVLAHPFDPAQGYGVIDSDHCRVLVVRQEESRGERL